MDGAFDCTVCECKQLRWNGDVITGEYRCKCGHLASDHDNYVPS